MFQTVAATFGFVNQEICEKHSRPPVEQVYKWLKLVQVKIIYQVSY